MNNLVFASLITVAALGWSLRQHERIETVASENRQFTMRAEKARTLARAAREEERRFESLYTTESVAVQTLRSTAGGGTNRVTQTSSALASGGVANQLSDPAHEGLHPLDKPYFYLAKSRLDALSYWPIAEGDRLSETAAALLAMSPAEEAAATAIYHQMREEIRSLEMSQAIPTNTPPNFAGGPGTKTTLFIPKISSDALKEINARFATALDGALGEERGRLLTQRINETFDSGGNQMKGDRFVILIRDDKGYRLVVTNGRGNMTSSREIGLDGKSQIPPDYAHLFKE